nr:hypothetical protein [Lactiplantibacillus plantarum]
MTRLTRQIKSPTVKTPDKAQTVATTSPKQASVKAVEWISDKHRLLKAACSDTTSQCKNG